MTETKKNPIGRFIENTLVPISTAFPRTDTSAASAQAPKT